MANVVNDPLTNWKNDADAGDNNNPQDGDLVAATTTTALAGNLRRIKSEVRQFTTDPVWINYVNIPVPGGGGVVGTLPTLDTTRQVLSFSGDWTALTHTGRRLRITFGTTPTTYAIATISNATFAAGLTQVSVFPAVPAGTLSAVEFSALDSPVIGAGGLNPYTLDLTTPTPPSIFTVPAFVVPAHHGGTERTNLNLGGDLSGTLTDPTIADNAPLPVTVTGIRGNPVLAGVPLQNQALAWNGAAWQGISVLMSLTATTADITKGTIVLPTGTSALGSVPLQIKWLSFLDQTLVNTAVTILTAQTWDSPFPNNYFGGVVSLTGNSPNTALIGTLVLSGTNTSQVQISVTNLTQIGNDGGGNLVINSGALLSIGFVAFVVAIGN